MSTAPDDAAVEAAVDAVLEASRALVAISARSIASVPGVTFPQFRMLVVLERAPTNLSGLAAALDVAPSTAMRMVDRLVEAGSVQRDVHPEDRRQTVLSLTARGRRVVRRVTDRRRRDLTAVLARLPERDRDDVARALAMFAAGAAEALGASLPLP